jgi:hypothetical protein
MKNLGLSGTIVTLTGLAWFIGGLIWGVAHLGLLGWGIVALALLACILVWVWSRKQEAPPLVMHESNWNEEEKDSVE